jgi:hypothetical protein
MTTNLVVTEDDRIFMMMVHPVDPHHFVHASSMVSGRLVEALAKNSKPKGFEDCNGKAISKVMGWGMILNMIRDKNGTQETGEGW